MASFLYTGYFTEEEVRAITEYTGSHSTSYDPGSKTLTLTGTTIGPPSREVLIELVKTNKFNNRVVDAISDVNAVAKDLTVRLKTLLNGGVIPLDQQERYKAKEKAALANDTPAFIEEAELLGIEPETLINLVLSLSGSWDIALNTGLLKIDAFRVKLKSLVASGEFEFVEFVLNEVIALETIDPNVKLVPYFEEVKLKYLASVTG